MDSLRLNHTRDDMVRAAFEGTAYGLKQILNIANEKWGVILDELLSVGGGSRNTLWTQIKADILQVEYNIAQTADAAALAPQWLVRQELVFSVALMTLIYRL